MKSLNVFLFVALLLVLITVREIESKKMTLDEAKQTLKGFRKSCAKKTDAPKELLDGQHKGQFPKDERLMCYMKCLMVATKSMKNDEILYDFFLKNARLMLIESEVARVEVAVDLCRKSVVSTDGCEKAWEFGKCIYEHDSELYLAP